ncbi:nose resistant to fluoxetine protein 6-like [Topomyia yanbarensis]|uniref:nose resistant to fluoxetine protein 6-like n=1 Tax=Topomyia yanbarensis TaxID=2498891 RepID=UPI00273C36AD|nr:nose resistant to fluoxetine protein 6-like [Topomyia yanbarensis]
MKSTTLLSLVTFVTVQWFPVTSGFGFGVQFNMSEYWQMPALFQYESIEGCLRSNPAGVFCVVKSVVKPDDRSLIWRTIEKYSQYPYQYQHSVLTRGICLEQCEELVKTLTDRQRVQFLQAKFDVEYRYIINDWMLPNIHNYRHQYGRLVNICQNYRMRTKYNISVYSELEHCTTNSTRRTDYLDIVFYATILSLLLLTIASTVYDSLSAKDHNHYRMPLKGTKANLLTAFSLRRNINRLTIKLKTDPIQQDLRFLDAVRVHIMSSITFSHVVIGLGMTTSQNPEVMEKLLSRPGVQMFLSLVPFEVDVFFAISGLLLAVHFIKYTEGKRFGFKPFWMGVVNRYLRSLPVYALVMLFSISIFDRLQISPSAYKIMPMVRTICRDKWWTNLLFINNYYRPGEQCLIHTWYLAADFQLFVTGLTILMVLWKCNSLLRPITYFLLIVGMVLPMVNVYYNSVDAMMLLNLKGSAFQMWYDEWFTRTYQATETHCLCYFAGMLVGIIYHKMQNDDLLLAKSKLYKTLQYLTFPVLVLFCLPAPLFQQFSFSKPSVWMALYAGIHRLVTTCFVNVGFLLLMFAERDSFFGKLRMSSLLENAFYRVLGRLSFGFYLIHMNVLKTIYGNHHEALRISLGLLISVFCSAMLITYTLSLLAYISVEKPFDIIFKQLLGSGTRDTEGKGGHTSTVCSNTTTTTNNNNNSTGSLGDIDHLSIKRRTPTTALEGILPQ